MVALPPAPSQLTPPAPIPSQPVSIMPTLTPYQPRATLAQPTPFGIPMAQPGQTGSSRQPQGRARRAPANQQATGTWNHCLKIKVMLVLFPRDVSWIILFSQSNTWAQGIYFSLMDRIKILMGLQILATSKPENSSIWTSNFLLNKVLQRPWNSPPNVPIKTFCSKFKQDSMPWLHWPIINTPTPPTSPTWTCHRQRNQESLDSLSQSSFFESSKSAIFVDLVHLWQLTKVLRTTHSPMNP